MTNYFALGTVMLMLTAANSATQSERSKVLAAVQEFIESEGYSGRSPLCDGATLEFANGRRSDPDTRRLWKDVPSSGVRFRSRLIHSTITMQRDRARVDTAVLSRVYYNQTEFSGVTYTIWDRLELRREANRWCILSTYRSIRTKGNDDAWHRRQPKR
jgi:hypothetical protein